jgi:2-polyprenyl-3-methyl-5-hydroxy-6-metoxy-1,4-benzoquinol methylase
MTDIIKLLQCPINSDGLSLANDYLISESNLKYSIEKNIYRLMPKTNVDSKTNDVLDFYLENPFPHYNNEKDLETFLKKKDKNFFVNSIKQIIKPNDNVLDFGCGTGQLGNFLAATTSAKIISSDLSINSLRLGNRFASNYNIKGISFVESNIFNPCFKKNSFDLIICNGVLHHLINPYLGFEILESLLKPGGYIVIGLYNKISRLKNSFIKTLSNIFGETIYLLFDKVYRSKNNLAKKSWKMDQYFHPLEKRYYFKDLHKWFKDKKINFINSIPSYDKSLLFHEECPPGDFIDQINIQIIDLIETQDGGLFIFLGKK